VTVDPLQHRAGFSPDADWPAAWPSASFVDADAVHVVRLWLPDRFAWAQEHAGLLSDDERRRAERFVFEPVRQRFVACRAALRDCLARCLNREPAELAFEYGPHGKPRLTAAQNPQGLSFNVAHSVDVALIALGRNCELGVDVESIPSAINWQGIARRFLASAEWTQLQQLPPDLQRLGFYRVWTCKEAYLKATARGLSLPLGQFAVCADPRLPARLVSADDEADAPARWQIRTLHPAPEYAAAVMWDGPSRPVAQWTWIPP
jgi:4'-phosphopantetheinyl transferase